MTRRISSGQSLSGTGGDLGALLVAGSSIASSGNNNLTLDPSGTGVVTTPDTFVISDLTSASGINSGALQVSGGLGVTKDIFVAGTVNLNGNALNGIPLGTVTQTAARFTTFTANDLATINSYSEIIGAPKISATGTVIHDISESNTWFHSSMSANFTANFTNVPTTNNRTITINLIFSQSSVSAFCATAVQINGVGVSINWLGGTPTINKQEIQTITLIRRNNAWTVTATIASYGAVLDGSSALLAALNARTLMENGITTSGVYWINFPSIGPTQVYCDMTTDGGGWMMLGYLGDTTVGDGTQAVFSFFGTIATTRVANQTSFCRMDVAKSMAGSSPNTSQMMWRRTGDSNVILIHSLDELWNRMGQTWQQISSQVPPELLNFESNVNGTGLGFPINHAKISNSGPAGLKKVGGMRYEGGPQYPGIAWNSDYQNNSDGVGTYNQWLGRRSIWYWETNGVQSNGQWSHASPLQMGPSISPTTGQGRRDIELYFRINPVGNA